MKPLSKLLLRASFLGMFSDRMLVPLYTALTNRFGGGILDAGIAYALFSMITGLFVMVVGQTQWFERSHAKMLFWGFVVAGVCDLGYIFVVNKWEFFAIQVLLGLSIGMLDPSWDALYSADAAEEDSHAKRWSFWTGGSSFVTGASALTGAIIVTTIGFRWLFIIMAVCDVFAVYYSYRAMRLHDGQFNLAQTRSGVAQ